MLCVIYVYVHVRLFVYPAGDLMTGVNWGSSPPRCNMNEWVPCVTRVIVLLCCRFYRAKAKLSPTHSPSFFKVAEHNQAFTVLPI